MAGAQRSFLFVALAGFVRPMQVRTQKLFVHCAIRVIELPIVAEPMRALRNKVNVDAVVIDARGLPPTSEPASAFIEFVSSSREASGGAAPMSVIVLGNKRVPRWVRGVCEQHGARFLSTQPRGPNYPELIRVLREMRGVDTACCSSRARQTRLDRGQEA